MQLRPYNMNWEDGLCLIKSWKPLICSLTDSRKPQLHYSRSGFSVGAAQVRAHGPYQGTKYALSGHSPTFTLMSGLPSPTSAVSSPPRAYDSLPYTSVPCPTHPYTFLHAFFLDQQNRPHLAHPKLVFLSPIGSLGGLVRAQRFYCVARRANGNWGPLNCTTVSLCGLFTGALSTETVHCQMAGWLAVWKRCGMNPPWF
jgi:hypothetical protein